MGVLIGIGNIEKVEYDQTEKSLIVTYTDGHTDSVDLSPLDRADAVVATETTARKNADTTLQNSIDSETTARKNADSTIQSAIDQEIERAKSAEQSNSTNIATNTSNIASVKETAENALSYATTLNGTAEKTANRVTTIDDNSDDLHYPTAKASKDYTDAHTFSKKYDELTGRPDLSVYALQSALESEADTARENEENLQTAVDKKAEDDEVVHLAGEETISGAKTFTENIKIDGTYKSLQIWRNSNERDNVAQLRVGPNFGLRLATMDSEENENDYIDLDQKNHKIHFSVNKTEIANITSTSNTAGAIANAQNALTTGNAVYNGMKEYLTASANTEVSGLSSYWVKLASEKNTAWYADQNLVFELAIPYAANQRIGLFRLHTRSSNPSNKYDSITIEQIAGTWTTYDLEMVRVYYSDASKEGFEIWVNLVSQYRSIRMRVLDNYNRRYDNETSRVTLYNTTLSTAQTQSMTNYITPTNVGVTQTDLAGKQDKLTWDTAPQKDSTNPVTSGGIFNIEQSVFSAFLQKVNVSDFNKKVGYTDKEEVSITSTTGYELTTANKTYIVTSSVNGANVLPGVESPTAGDKIIVCNESPYNIALRIGTNGMGNLTVHRYAVYTYFGDTYGWAIINN